MNGRNIRLRKILYVTLIIILCLQPLFALPYDIMGIGELRGLSVTEEPTAYVGSNLAFQRMATSRFTDISGAEANAALRMALLGVVKGSGAGKFNPSGGLTTIDGIILINRVMGNENQVINSIAAQIVGQSPQNAQARLNDAHYAQATTLGITNATEGQSYYKPLTRELFFSWIARATGLTTETTTPILNTAKDNGGIAPERRGLIEALLKDKIISLNNGSLNPKGTITRKDAIMILDTIAPRFYTALGFQEQYGVVIGVKSETSSLYGKTLQQASAVVRLEDGNLVRIQVQSGMQNGTDTDVATLKGSKVSGLKALAIGDEVRLLMSDATTVQIAEVLPVGAVLSILKNTLEGDEAILKHVGNIEQIIPESQTTADSTKTGYRLRVRGVDGILNDILVLSDSKTGIRSDVIVTKSGVMTYGNQYTVGNTVKYYVKPENEVIYLSLDQAGVVEVSGTLQKIEVDDQGKYTLTVYDYENKLHSYALSPHVAISVNFRPASPVDLKAGSEVRLLAVDGIITRLSTESYIREPGYIPPGSRIVFGQVQYVQGNSIYLLNDAKNPYLVDAGTIFSKNGLGATLNTLKEGDQVKFYLSHMVNNTLFKVEIEGPEQMVAGVYKANVKSFKLSTNALGVSDPYALLNQEWVRTAGLTAEVQLSKDVQVYQGGQLVPKSALSGLTGQGVYYVTQNVYGREEVARIVVKGANERVYSDSVKVYDPVVSQLELVNRVNVTLPLGTIVLKDGRLVSESAIVEKDGIFVVGSSALGSTQAAIVQMIPGGGKSFDTLYAGSIEVVNSYAVQFGEVYQNSDFSWSSLGESKFFMSDDTVITDLSGSEPVSLERYDFFHGSYSREDNEDTDNEGLAYERYYSFFVVSPQTQDIIGMILRHKALIKDKNIDDEITSEGLVDNRMEESLDPLLYTRGIVEGFDVEWNRVKLRDSYDYVDFHGEWNPNRTSIYIELAGTLIVKGDKVIQFEDLAIGDQILVVRDDEDAIYLRVEE